MEASGLHCIASESLRNEYAKFILARAGTDHVMAAVPVGLTTKIDMLILLVEDEPLVRMLGADVLLGAGFEVVEAGNADEALEILQSESGIAAVVTDIDMPGSMDGLALARHAHEHFGSIPALVISGKVRPSRTELPAISTFMPKPYAPEALVRELRELIAAAA